MSCNDEFSPGQNLDFVLITSGLDINPLNGTVGVQNYEYLKRIISENTEILYEAPALRYIDDVNISTHLPGYDNTPRTVYQILFGLASYSNSWTPESLTVEINRNPIFPRLEPQWGEYSINPYELYEQNIGVYKCIKVGPTQLSWSFMADFKITETMPGFNDGKDKDVWGVLQNGKIEIFIKNAFQWMPFEEFVEYNESTFSASINPPTMVEGRFWLKTANLNVYEYSSSGWSAEIETTFTNLLTGSWNDGDLILDYENSALRLYEYQGGKYERKKLSNFTTRIKSNNSTFCSGTSANFMVEDGCIALLGGSISYLFDEENNVVKVYQDGVFKGNFTSLDFYGPTVTPNGDIANVEYETNPTNPTDINLEVVSYSVDADGQTLFDGPTDMALLINMSVNGVDESAFSYNAITNKLTFDPIQAKYSLETTDHLILTYIKSEI